MADIRIKDLPTTATQTASDDFIALDGTVNGTRKIDASAPSFKTSVTSPSVVAPASTPLTLTGGTSGASLVLGATTSGVAAVTRGSAAGSAMTWTNGTVTSAMYLQSTGSPAGAALGTTTNHPLFFFTNSSGAQSVLTTTGNLLIGTTTDMTGSGGLTVASNAQKISRFSSTFATTGSYVEYYDAVNAATRGYVGWGTVLGMGAIGNYGITSAGNLYLGSNTGANNAVYTSTGNLLIGTTTDMTGSGGLKIAGTTASTGVGTGALQVAGGIYAGAASVFGGTITASSTIIANAGTGVNTVAGSNTSATGFGAYFRGGSAQGSGKYLLQLVNYDASKNYLFYDDIATFPGAATFAGAVTAAGLTAPASTPLTLTGGSTGASLVLGQGTNGSAAFTLPGSGGLTATQTRNGQASIGLTNASTGTGAFASLLLANSGFTGVLYQFGTGYTTSGRFVQDSLLLDSNGTGGLAFGAANGNITWYQGGNTVTMRLAATTGNLLIGGTTDIPGSGGLKVFGTTAASSTASGALQVAGGVGVVGAGYFGGLLNVSGSSGINIGAGFQSTAASMKWSDADASGLVWSMSPRLGDGVATNFAFYAASTLVQRWSSTGNSTIGGNLTVSGTGTSTFAGNVGIGTTSPTNPLEVNGIIYSNKTTATGFYARNTTSGAASTLELQSTGTGGADWILATGNSAYGGANEDFNVYKNAAGTGSEGSKFTIKASGTVSIPSTTAGSAGAGALVVAGGIYAGAASVFGSTVAVGTGTGATDASITVNGTATTQSANVKFQAGGVGKWIMGRGVATGNNNWILFNETLTAAALTVDAATSAATFAGAVAIGNTVNTVSPTSPNRTVTMVIGGVTYYLAAKTTND